MHLRETVQYLFSIIHNSCGIKIAPVRPVGKNVDPHCSKLNDQHNQIITPFKLHNYTTFTTTEHSVTSNLIQKPHTVYLKINKELNS